MKIALLLSSVRDNRLADIVLKKVLSLISSSFEFTIVDPLEYSLPMINKRYYEMKQPEEKYKKLHDIFAGADGFLIVTAEYNHSVPPALTNMLDHFGSEFSYKSCGIISYSSGPVGGARATEHLKLICSNLGMSPVPLSPAWGLATKAGLPEGKAFEDNFEKSFATFIKQFIWFTKALTNHRNSNPVG